MSTLLPSEVYERQQELKSAEYNLRWVRDHVEDDLYTSKGGYPSSDVVEAHADVIAAKAEVLRVAAEVQALQAEIGGIVFDVAVENLEAVAKKLTKLNKKAARFDTGEIDLRVTDERHIKNYNPDYGKYAGTRCFDFEHVYCILSGVTPQIPGFKFVASVQHNRLEDGSYANIVRAAPEFQTKEVAA